MIQIKEITFKYAQNTPILQDFTWEVQSGEAWAVLGPSGCGKSTLLYLLAGLRTPQKGQILVDLGCGGSLQAGLYRPPADPQERQLARRGRLARLVQL